MIERIRATILCVSYKVPVIYHTAKKINKKTYLIYLVEYYLIMEASSSKNQPLRYAIRTVKYQNSLMVNVCDLYLIDKQINHGKITINMKKNYWMDKIADENEIESYLKKSSISNLAGEETVNKAIEMNLAKRASVKYFSDVPFLMIYRFAQSY
ncbi:MAG: DUF424 domain-containing protein [Thermoproteota archaeon]|nr:DUF424 domain-containing protein [Thermoproteota archaeon]